MRLIPTLLLLVALPLAGARKPTTAQLKAQITKLTEERDGLKQRLAATEDLQQELASTRAARDQAATEAEACRKTLEQLRATLKENQGGSEAMIRELREAKEAAESAEANVRRLKAANEALQHKVSAAPAEGDLVVLGEEVEPARPINLTRVTPRVKASSFLAARPRGTVVVNVLVSEKGDVLAARLLQGLPGDSADARQAEVACVEAAKSLVFDPATSKDRSLHFKVWQGVGFYLD